MLLNSGDCVYYKPHSALGLLIERFVDPDGCPHWSYALRSPSRSSSQDIVVSIQETTEESLRQNIESGRLTYFTGHKETKDK